VPANTGISEEAVRAQVARLLAWEGLVGADRLGRFLEFTTEKVLSGRVEDIKEYTLGVEVCGRPDSFDPRVESVVRNTASRLRTKLTEYYLTAGRLDPVEIELPKGGYVPEFRERVTTEPGVIPPAGAPERPRPIRAWIAAAAAAGLIAGGLAGAILFRGRPTAPAAVRFKLEFLNGTPPVAFPNAGPASISPDGTKIAYVTSSSTDQGMRLYIHDLASGTAKAVEGTGFVRNPFWSPNSQSIAFFSGTHLWAAPLGGGLPRQICEAGDARGGAWNQSGDILFALPAPNGLLRASSGGGTPQPLLTPDFKSGETGYAWPFFLPDGRHFLFTAMHSRIEESAIYVGRLDDPAWRKLVVKAHSNAIYADGFLFHVDGSALVAQRFDIERLERKGDATTVEASVGSYEFHALGDFSVSAAGVLALRRPVPTPARRLLRMNREGAVLGEIKGHGLYRYPRISPDGKKLAVEVIIPGQVSGSLWVFSTDGTNPRRITFDSRHESHPLWSPDGTRLLFSAARANSGDVYSKPAEPGTPDELVLASSPTKRPVSWSSDGRMVLLQVRESGRSEDLWALPMQGDRKPFPLIQTAATEMDGRFSPDNRWIAYSSDEPRPWSVFVERMPTEGKLVSAEAGQRERVLVGTGVSPSWRSDGRELYYVESGQLMAATVETGDRFRVVSTRALFPVSEHFHRGFGYAAAPDGQWFLFSSPIPAPPATPEPVTVVLNWSSKLVR
jgi:Tol biopolymer transport system component